MQRHLAALEALDGHAAAGGLALAASARLLALAGADTPADAHAVLRGAFVVANVVQSHDARPDPPSTTVTRCFTFSIMPRTSGVSGRVLVRLILLRPRPTSVWRCLASGRIGEPICFTVISAILSPLTPLRRRRRRDRRRGGATAGSRP